MNSKEVPVPRLRTRAVVFGGKSIFSFDPAKARACVKPNMPGASLSGGGGGGSGFDGGAARGGRGRNTDGGTGDGANGLTGAGLGVGPGGVGVPMAFCSRTAAESNKSIPWDAGGFSCTTVALGWVTDKE